MEQEGARLLHADAAYLSGDYLYVLSNQGVFDCYDLKTGAELYRERIPHHGSGFSAPPVAADGKIYLPSEDGDVFIVRAGRTFEILGRQRMGEPLMATPAIAGNAMYVRGEKRLFAIGEKRDSGGSAVDSPLRRSQRRPVASRTFCAELVQQRGRRPVAAARPHAARRAREHVARST